MEASKVSVSAHYLKFERMGRNKKADLRRRNVLDLIRSKPSGTPITLAEFQEVCAFTTTAGAYGLIKTMLDRGTIVREVEGLNRHSYYIAADAVKREREKERGTTPQTEIVTPPATNALTDYAKQFAWEKNSDSLREFIKYMDGIELDIRRKTSEVQPR